MKRNESNATGNIFHIIHGSFVDGYGLRTTVFLKGCPLRCKWCCNPEGQSSQPEIKLTAEKCNGCGRCVDRCDQKAITIKNDGGGVGISIDRELCSQCGNCIDACYTGALEMFGQHMTVDDVFNEIKKDEQFYRNSGGGATIGGGEPTMQSLFTLQMIRKCKENHIHIAIDTCGYTTTDTGFEVLAEADLLLFDLKGMDTVNHTRNTGVPNEIIHQNLSEMNDMGKPIIVRIPVIPGLTDSKENLSCTAEMLSGLRSVERVDLMAFHNYGGIKYRQLEMPNELASLKPPGRKKMEEIRTLFESKGLPVQIGG